MDPIAYILFGIVAVVIIYFFLVPYRRIAKNHNSTSYVK